VTEAPRAGERLVAAVAIALAAGALLNLALSCGLPPPWNETVFTQQSAFGQGRMSRDSWDPMEAALRHLESGDPRHLYDAVFFDERIKFQYPPTALLPLDALGYLGASSVFARLNVLTWLAVAITAFATGGLLSAGSGGPRRAALFLLGAAATLTFYPVMKAYSLGQIQAWITALLALLLLAWVRGRRTTAGVLLGLVFMVKPHFAVVALWALLRRERRFAAAAAITAAVVAALSVHRYGLANHLNYVKALSFMGRHGEAFYPNQSMNGLLHRLLFNGNNLQFAGDRFAPFDPVVLVLTALSSLLLLAFALFGRVAPGARGGPLDLSAILLATVMASPIAWEHHYGVLAPIDALLAGEVVRTGERRRIALLGLSYLLSANFLAVAQRLAETAWNPLQSYLYLAALIAYAMLLAARKRDQGDGAAGGTSR
jgi:hypothetical protein